MTGNTSARTRDRWLRGPVLTCRPDVRLIQDVLLGDRSLFTRPDGLERVGQVTGALLADKPEPVISPKGFWGPAEGDILAEPIGSLLRY